MASTATGEHLTRQHRERQLALRAITIRQMLAVWPAFTLDDIDASWQPVEASLIALTLARHRDSAGLAAGYYQSFRAAEGVGGTAMSRLAVPPSAEVVRYSLGYTGPITAKKLIGAGRSDVLDQTFVHTAGAVGRYVLNGGRDTLIRSVKADRQAFGWQRVTGGNPCQFCEMLAGRGAVFKESTVGFEAHDHCACTSEPVFRR